MIVALDVTPLAGPRTGIGHFVAELLRALGDRDADPEVLPYVLSARTRRNGLPEGTRRLPVPAAAAIRWWGRSDRPAFDARLAPATVVHGTNFAAPPTRGLGTVLTVHDCAFVRFPDLCSPAVRALVPAVQRAVDRGAWVHTPTEFVAGEVRELFGTDRVRAVWHGIPHLTPPGPRPPLVERVLAAGPYVLSLGTLEPRKRPQLLVHALEVLHRSHPDLQVVLAGPDGPARPAVDAAVATLPASARDRVRVVGHVPDDVRSALLHHAAVFAYPTRYEGFGFPILEAMAARVPVVATRGGGVIEVAGGAALLVEATRDALAEGVQTALADDGERARLVEAGVRRIGRFDWRTSAEGLVSLYREASPHGG